MYKNNKNQEIPYKIPRKTNKNQKILYKIPHEIPHEITHKSPIYLSASKPANVINVWSPHRRFKATWRDRRYVEDNCFNFGKSVNQFHAFLKFLEVTLIEEFSDMINQSYLKGNNNIIWNWIDNATVDWRRLALVRDYHDHRCGRDKTHHVRTDACRRFVSDVMNGMNIGYFSKYVDMILSGKTCPRQFVHPAFKIFNTS
jgi:hypothetical protein